MPKKIQNNFKNQKNIRYREKTGIYEIRKRIDGIDYFASSKNRDEAVRKFIKLLRTPPEELRKKKERRLEPVQPPLEEQLKQMPAFSQVCEEWLELKRPTIKQRTYDYYVQVFDASILPSFYGRTIDQVKQSDVQKLINDYIGQEKFRTATKIYQTLKAVFDYAVGEDLLERSPMRKIRPPKYEERGGVALTLEEKWEFIRLLEGSKCDEEIKAALLFLLYTGIRRSELASARIEGGFVSVVNAKTRKGFQEKRRIIPVTPMLAAWMHVIKLDKLRGVRPDALTQAFKRLMPSHHLHELRHTFITRAQECGVPREVVSVWAGHAADGTQTSNVYTHFSAEFMKEQAKKVDYEIQLHPIYTQ